jgi:adenine-specific DNA-methyltransferase
MIDEIRDLILTLLPADGTAKGNLSLLASIKDQIPDVTEEDYWLARDSLVDDGVIAKGRGRGGSVYRLPQDEADILAEAEHEVADENEDDDEDDKDLEADDDARDFELTSIEEAAPRASGKAKKRSTRRAPGPKSIVSYRHKEKRSNNPEVGMVHPENDPDQPKTTCKDARGVGRVEEAPEAISDLDWQGGTHKL